jgi:Glyoxalase-like domain
LIVAGIAQLAGIVLECPDPRALAGFYSQLTGLPIIDSDDEWASIGDRKSVTLSFQRAPGFKPPVWPDPGSSMQSHLDLWVADLDLDRAEKSAEALGARKFDHQPNPANFRVMADPAGHPFCLCIT